MIEEAAVAVCKQRQVFLADRTLVINAAPAHALVERLRLRLQINDQIGPGRLRPERVEYLLVEAPLVGRKRQAREQRILSSRKSLTVTPLKRSGCASSRSWLTRWNRKNSWVGSAWRGMS